ncbi:la-related protein 6A [Silene latifolia]|uniref:la-related protein 6A n=1 Tax=Silene latifolia TaxID=37657 RepID=UPI003D77CDC5
MEGGGVKEARLISTVDSALPSTATTATTASPEISTVDSSAVDVEVVDSSPPSDDADSPPQSAAASSVVDSSPPSDGADSPPQSAAASSGADLHAKIIKQVEYYFSDENLPSDKFLIKYVKKDKQGFVPISVIATFRKVKRLTKDSSVIVDALKESSQLVVSSDGKKVKRLHPLPSSLTNPSSETNSSKLCTIVVENLPEDSSTENIRRIFGQVGSIKSISIHDPQVTGDANRTKAEKQISGKLHALIEYETEEDAEKAVALNDETDWRNGLRVQLLRKRMGHEVGRKARKGSDSEKGGQDRVPASVKEGDKTHSNEKPNDDPDDKEGDHVSKEKNGQKGRNRSKGRKYRGNNGMGHGTTSAIEPSKPPPGPKMPDGTKGFAMGRGRPIISGNV